ncbi:hypothetical protein OOK31_26910 [Streptomyces sp. NBC_00249]|uniref:hypothetical protein n=1 Tax=Streptomyces sp. NBC_00249 TaxID=2975690 RepID=UPI00225BEB75|nr:hypothetical protein [Streptomyces sp. NBC_00249]MCX5197484.1 hypothetical protein [Streptomyces sp. NBC_00249]
MAAHRAEVVGEGRPGQQVREVVVGVVAVGVGAGPQGGDQVAVRGEPGDGPGEHPAGGRHARGPHLALHVEEVPLAAGQDQAVGGPQQGGVP